MPSFVYVARETASGREIRSSVEAATEQAAISALLNRNMLVVSIAEKVGKQVKSSMMYPIVVSVVAILITIFLLVKVVPVFGEIFASFGAALPAPTQYLVNISTIVKKYLVFILAAGGGAVYAWLYFIKTPIGRQFWDGRRIKLPVFGSIAHKICLARFTRTLASLIRSGVPILEVLQIVSQTVGHVIMEKAIKTAASDIERGESISAALSKHPVFPNMIIRMIT